MAGNQDHIILCFECGAKNRLNGNWTGAPLCGNCGERLPVEPRKPLPSPISRSHAPKDRFLSGKLIWAIGILVVGGLLASNYLPSRGGSDGPALTPLSPTAVPPKPVASLPPASTASLIPAPVRKPTLIPVQAQPGILVYDSPAAPLAPFRLETSAGADYFVKLVDAISGRDVVGIYVAGGLPLEVEVPLGHFEMRYASGKIWYGTTHLFGPDTQYAKAESIFSFDAVGGQISGYTVELIMQVNGNLDTRNIRAEQF